MKVFMGGASIGALAALPVQESNTVATAVGQHQRALLIPRTIDDVPAIDDIVHGLNYFDWGITLVRLGVNLHGSQPGAWVGREFVVPDNRDQTLVRGCYGIQAVGSLLTFILTFISVNIGPYNDLAISSILSSVQGTMHVYTAFDFKNPIITTVVILVKFGTGMGGNLFLIKSATAPSLPLDAEL
jgi:hypothetical protein